LRELQKTLLTNEGLSKRDALDLDGRQFQFVFGEMLRLFEQALWDAGVDGPQAQNVMCRFDDLRRANDETLRIGVSQIETAPVLCLAREVALLTSPGADGRINRTTNIGAASPNCQVPRHV